MNIRLITVLCALLISCTALPSLGISTNSNYEHKTNFASIDEETNLTQYWALLVAPPEYKEGMPVDDFVKSGQHWYDKLILYGWSENNIKTLFYENATRLNLITEIENLREKCNPSDTVFIYLADHGYKEGFCLYNQYITYEELDMELDKLEVSSMCVIISACYSGAAIQYLKQDGRVIVTGPNAPVFGLPDFTESTSGSSDYNLINGNKKGVISIEEIIRCYNDQYASYPGYTIDDETNGETGLFFENYTNGRVDQFSNINMKPNAQRWIRGYSFPPGNTYYAVAQSFIPSYDILTKVELKIMGNSQFMPPLTVSIRDNLTGPDLTSVSLNYTRFPNWHWNPPFTIFDFPDINVIAGQTYFIVCNSSREHSDGAFYIIHGRADDAYQNGICYEQGRIDEPWNISNEIADLFFVTYGKNSTNNPPHTPKRPFGIIYGEAEKYYPFCASTDDTDGDLLYYMFNNDGDTSDWIGPFNSGEVCEISLKFIDFTSNRITVKVKDEHGAESPWSEPLLVKFGNAPPSVPEKPYRIIYDHYGKQEIFYCTKATDRDYYPGLYYNFSWDDGVYSGWIGPYDSEEEIRIQHEWSSGNEWKIKVKAKDKHGDESDWSDTLILTDNTPPKIEITKPKKAFYINNKEIRRYLVRNPLIIGDITINIEYYDETSGIKSINLFIDNKLRMSGFEYYGTLVGNCSYDWSCSRIYLFKHRHVIRVEAYDNAGNKAVEKLVVWRFS